MEIKRSDFIQLQADIFFVLAVFLGLHNINFNVWLGLSFLVLAVVFWILFFKQSKNQYKFESDREKWAKEIRENERKINDLRFEFLKKEIKKLNEKIDELN